MRAFEAGGGAGKPLYLQVKLSYARSYAAALAVARAQWRQNVLSAEQSEQLSQPEAYEQLGQQVSDERLAARVVISHDPSVHREALQAYLDMGFQRLYLHNVNLKQERFIDDLATRVVPALQLPPLWSRPRARIRYCFRPQPARAAGSATSTAARSPWSRCGAGKQEGGRQQGGRQQK